MLAVDVLAAGVRSDILSLLPRTRSDQKKRANAGHDPTVNRPAGDAIRDSSHDGAVRAVGVGFTSGDFEYCQGDP